MGGHAAWRKRVARGEPAKGGGGAICRHRPHLGRKGADLALNRKGNLGGKANPKKRRKDDSINRAAAAGLKVKGPDHSSYRWLSRSLLVVGLILGFTGWAVVMWKGWMR